MGTEAVFQRSSSSLAPKVLQAQIFLVTPQAGHEGFRSQPMGGSRHGYWEEEAICVEMKVSMTLWLDGSKWPWPLVDSEL